MQFQLPTDFLRGSLVVMSGRVAGDSFSVAWSHAKIAGGTDAGRSLVAARVGRLIKEVSR